MARQCPTAFSQQRRRLVTGWVSPLSNIKNMEGSSKSLTTRSQWFGSVTNGMATKTRTSRFAESANENPVRPTQVWDSTEPAGLSGRTGDREGFDPTSSITKRLSRSEVTCAMLEGSCAAAMGRCCDGQPEGWTPTSLVAVGGCWKLAGADFFDVLVDGFLDRFGEVGVAFQEPG